jgi:hypothetical protein
VGEAEGFCPYVGLQPFTVGDRDYFFGREREQRVIAANLFAAPLTVLYGPSAVGKSSVLQAGVVPRLASEANTAIVYFASWQGDGYLASLKKACRAAFESKGVSIDVDDGAPLDDWIVSARAKFRGVLLLILDQFEEYLLYHGEQDDTAFDGELARTVNRADVGVNVLIGLRDDSLSKLNRFSKRIPNLMGNSLQLRRLTVESAQRAVTGPLEQYNKRYPASPARIEDALVARVLDEVRTEKVAPSLSGGVAGLHSAEERGLIETAFLQLVLTELWRAAPIVNGERVLTTSTLDALGGPKGIVRRHVTVELGRLSSDGREIASRLFQHLVTPSGAKYALRTEDLIDIAGRPRERVVPVLVALSTARLLRRIDPPERYEIFHDAFAVAMLDWRKDYVQRQRLRTGVASGVGGVLILGIVAGTAIYVVHQRRDAEQTQLNLQVAMLRADESARATEAAKAAEGAAQSAAREAQLRLEAGQAELEATRARLSGQTKAQVDQAAQRAQQATTAADAAKAESAQRAQESKAKLAEADASRRKIEQLAEVAQTRGITLLGVPATPIGGLPAAAQPATPKGGPPNGSEATKPPPPTTSSGSYRDSFKKGVEATNERRWRDAQSLFETALQQNPTESTERITISGFGNVQPYVPHYYLGLALKNQNDCAGALKEWNESEHEGAIQKTNLYKALQQNRGGCGAK